jgi:23S rRNA pseudouridine2605 synthase
MRKPPAGNFFATAWLIECICFLLPYIYCIFAGLKETMEHRKKRPGSGGSRPSRKKPGTRSAASGPMRLNRYIANSGVCSRREADSLIKNGDISVNGKKVTEMGVKVMPGDRITYKGENLNPEKKVYLLLNKPRGYVTTVKDPHAEKKVMDLVHSACRERIYPVGRLDKETTGLLLFTNDGDLSGKLMHPSQKRKKVYEIQLNKPMTRADLEQLAAGVELDDGTVAADLAAFIDEEDKSRIGLEIHSGQNRVVRRMMETMNYRVKKLDRVYYAGLTKKSLPRGKWRFLSDKEINMLKRGTF